MPSEQDLSHCGFCQKWPDKAPKRAGYWCQHRQVESTADGGVCIRHRREEDELPEFCPARERNEKD